MDETANIPSTASQGQSQSQAAQSMQPVQDNDMLGSVMSGFVSFLAGIFEMLGGAGRMFASNSRTASPDMAPTQRSGNTQQPLTSARALELLSQQDAYPTSMQENSNSIPYQPSTLRYQQMAASRGMQQY